MGEREGYLWERMASVNWWQWVASPRSSSPARDLGSLLGLCSQVQRSPTAPHLGALCLLSLPTAAALAPFFLQKGGLEPKRLTTLPLFRLGGCQEARAVAASSGGTKSVLAGQAGGCAGGPMG